MQSLAFNKPKVAKAINLQDMFLNQVRKEGISVSIYLVGGIQLKGFVKGFDAFTILLEPSGKPTQLVYKHSIASIVPSKHVYTGKTMINYDCHSENSSESDLYEE